MFHEWSNFYLLTGQVAGTLIGLMFVVMTLIAGHEPSRIAQGAPVYVAPIVFHFAMVVVISALWIMPGLSPPAVGVITALCAAAGLTYSVATTIRIFRPGWEDLPERSDQAFYGILPTIIYLAFAGAAGAVWLAPKRAAFAIGAIMLALLTLGIRNAWDLTFFLVLMSHKRTINPGDSAPYAAGNEGANAEPATPVVPIAAAE